LSFQKDGTAGSGNEISINKPFHSSELGLRKVKNDLEELGTKVFAQGRLVLGSQAGLSSRGYIRVITNEGPFQDFPARL
jgi:hypothetical protein